MPTAIIFLNCCSSVAWRQSAWVSHPAKILMLNWRQSLFKLLIFVPLVKKSLTIKIFHHHVNTIVWLFPRYHSIRRLAEEVFNLSRYLILGMLLVQGNLICGCSELGTIITILGGTTLLVDRCNQLRSGCTYACTEGLSAGVKLC